VIPRERQPAWWCRSCGSAALVAGGYCRACYDRRRRSAQCFGGHRDAVLARDGCCQTCLAEARLVAQALIVHHRRPGVNRPAVHITLCRRCHQRIHRRQQLPGFYSDLFFRLWREVHPGAPAQLRLPLAA
jgi:hypothetical protein